MTAPTPELEALLQENRVLREEIAALKSEVQRAVVATTFQGRTAEQWAYYTREAERKDARRENAMRAAVCKLEEELG